MTCDVAVQADVLAAVAALNADDSVHGILVQVRVGEWSAGRAPVKPMLPPRSFPFPVVWMKPG